MFEGYLSTLFHFDNNTFIDNYYNKHEILFYFTNIFSATGSMGLIITSFNNNFGFSLGFNTFLLLIGVIMSLLLITVKNFFIFAFSLFFINIANGHTLVTFITVLMNNEVTMSLNITNQILYLPFVCFILSKSLLKIFFVFHKSTIKTHYYLFITLTIFVMAASNFILQITRMKINKTLKPKPNPNLNKNKQMDFTELFAKPLIKLITSNNKFICLLAINFLNGMLNWNFHNEVVSIVEYYGYFQYETTAFLISLLILFFSLMFYFYLMFVSGCGKINLAKVNFTCLLICSSIVTILKMKISYKNDYLLPIIAGYCYNIFLMYSFITVFYLNIDFRSDNSILVLSMGILCFKLGLFMEVFSQFIPSSFMFVSNIVCLFFLSIII